MRKNNSVKIGRDETFCVRKLRTPQSISRLNTKLFIVAQFFLHSSFDYVPFKIFWQNLRSHQLFKIVQNPGWLRLIGMPYLHFACYPWIYDQNFPTNNRGFPQSCGIILMVGDWFQTPRSRNLNLSGTCSALTTFEEIFRRCHPLSGQPDVHKAAERKKSVWSTQARNFFKSTC